MWGHLKFAGEALNQTAPNQIALNWTLWSQTKASIAKSSCDICVLLRYYVAFCGNPSLTLWGILSALSSKHLVGTIIQASCWHYHPSILSALSSKHLVGIIIQASCWHYHPSILSALSSKHLVGTIIQASCRHYHPSILSALSSKVKKSKNENRAQMNFLWGGVLCPVSKRDFWAPVLFTVFRQRSISSGLPFDWTVLSRCTL